VTAGRLLKNKLVFFFLCSRRGARKSLHHGRSSLRHCSQSVAWMVWGGGGSRTLCRWFHQPPLEHQLKSSQPHLSLFQPPLHCSALYGLWLALCRCNPTVIHFTPMPRAPASCCRDISYIHTDATQKHRVNPRGVVSIRHVLPFFSQNDWSFQKDQTTPH